MLVDFVLKFCVCSTFSYIRLFNIWNQSLSDKSDCQYYRLILASYGYCWNIQFIIIYDKEEHQIITFKKLWLAVVW